MARHSRNKIEPVKQGRIKVKTIVILNTIGLLVIATVLIMHLKGIL